ncbi:MAG: helix-hairpin-helix domain-containing protein [bacterium]|nr:helix-hairpin-helix domain-containing protein [bacterium]
MKRILILLILLFGAAVSASKIDINNSSLDALDSLMIPEEVIERIKEHMEKRGEISSIYDLSRLEGVDSEIFRIIKQSISVYPDTSIDSTSIYLIRMQDRLASEESPTEGAIDLWGELLMRKININTADANDLMLLDGVNLTDAEAILQARNKNKKFRYPNDVRRSENLTYFAWSRIRNYIGFSDYNKVLDFSGYYRAKMRFTNDDTYNYSSYSSLANELMARSKDLEIIHPDSANLRSALLKAGVLPETVDSIKARMEREYEDLVTRDMNGDIINKANVQLGKYLKGGILAAKYSGVEKYRLKGFGAVTNLPFIDNLIIGNYRVTLGQGLVMDNTDEYRSRRLDPNQGLFTDLTESYNTKFTGAALSGKAWRFNYIAFASKEKRDGILNPDSTVNSPLLSRTDITDFENKYEEVTAGGRVGFELGGLFKLPFVTEFGVSGYNAKYDRDFKPDTLTLDIPFDASNIAVPVYLRQMSGEDFRRVLGIDFRTAFKNLSFEGEGALQDASAAFIVKTNIVFDNFYLKTLVRHYDVDFDNLYARPFSEQARFDDTELEKTYRLIDPLFTFILDDPRPKSEEGIYLETRYRITEKVTFNYCYLDIWRTLDYNLYNYRFQGEIEVRPVFPLRIRLKHKFQEKNLYKDIVSTHSTTNETSLRIFAVLDNGDYINFESRYGMVGLTPSISYAENLFIDGSFLNGSYEKNVNDYFSVLGGFAVWQTNGMSQWIFEDNSIDFLYGDGNKLYLTFIDRLSELVSVRIKLSLKNQEINHSGIEALADELKYADTDFTRIGSFVDHSNLLGINVQMDLRW